MLEFLFVASVALGSSADTTVSIERGQGVVIENFSGRLIVRAWDRPEVRFEAETREEANVNVARSARELSFRPGRRWRNRSVTTVVRMPEWAPLDIRGNELDVEVEGLTGGLSVRTIEGDIRIREVSGGVVARSVAGVLEVEDVEGSLELFSLDDDVWVSRVRGDVSVEVGDGDIHLRRIDSRNVQASTVDGEVEFEGVIWPDGRYELTTHDGDITLEVDEAVSASVSVSTFDGDFTTELPVLLSGLYRSRELRFTLGGGEATIIMRAFDGEVRLVRSR
ncbi:MAG: DUF4097 family beta strand repeat protein [Gemmatimonadetes bacterium]|nr:DUF4097 family beta strand repeat protein [Gemmatimonadota bacterium]